MLPHFNVNIINSKNNKTSLKTSRVLRCAAHLQTQNLSGWTEHFGIYIHKKQQRHQNCHFIVMLGPWAVFHNSSLLPATVNHIH
jgi:hypothetical protein